MKDKLGSVAAGIFLFLWFGGWMVPLGIYHHFQIVCTDKPIKYSSRTEDNPNYDVSVSTVATKGQNGTERDCKRGGTQLVSKTVTKKPVQEVVAEGTKPYPSSDTWAGASTSYAAGNTTSWAPSGDAAGYGALNSAGCVKDQYVSGYYRSNGTYVHSYYRNSPTDSCYSN